jgi:hypothetical protein
MSWWIGGFAGFGVLVTHWLTYRLLGLDGHLHETGHGHLDTTSAIVLGLFVAGALRFCRLGLGGRAAPRIGPLALRLAALQAVGWLGMEVAERAMSGSLSTLDHHGLLLVGLAVQVVVACVVAAFVRLTGRVLEAVVARRASRHHRTAVAYPQWRDRIAHLVHGWGAQGVRGPPAPRHASV